MIRFEIEQWRAWAPGLEDAGAWRAWSQAPCRPASDDAQPDVGFLPAMQRRRLSRLARMAFAVATPLADGQPPMPLVYCSRHGDTARGLALFEALAREEPLSPTHFSLSVHNAIIGLWSIQRGDTSEMTALAAEGDGLEHALLEAAGLLAEGAPQVLLVIAEDSPPPLYRPWIDDVPFPYALALRLAAGDGWALALTPGVEAAPAEWPHALELIAHLNGMPGVRRLCWKHRTWTWQRHR